MMIYDLCFAWDWPYDHDFVQLVKTACDRQGLSLLQVTPDNLEQTYDALHRNEISMRAFFDRASDSDERFIPLTQWAATQSIYRINPFEACRLAWNKAYLHQAFTKAGLPTPKTILLPPYLSQPFLSPLDVGFLGKCFSIKPAHGGGGTGVITEATTWDQVTHFRQEYPQDDYLLQSFIVPDYLDSRQAWFRIIYCSGEVYPCWWDTYTHIYVPLTPYEEEHYQLEPLREMAGAIHDTCRLDLFSTEIARTPEKEFIIIDYVNDPLDMRLQSKAGEGVPDAMVADIANQLACAVKNKRQCAMMEEQVIGAGE